MIFITLGSQKFQFNRLLKKVDELIENGTINEEVFAQIGASDYKPQHFSYTEFMDNDTFSEYEKKADIVITHGGTGAIIGAVKQGKKVIAVSRLAKYGEHVDDHQVQLLRQFDDMGIIEACYDVDNLSDCYKKVLKTDYIPYVSNTKTIIGSIEEYILSAFGKVNNE
ncbi:MAG: beta(1,3)galactosyltransferase EpsH [Clostridia bacterium]|nr:beta(1,3)galactosyltransferase EpsH [Clostridia bacterium]